MFYLIILILLTNIIESFKVMKIIIPDTSGLNVVDKKFKPKYFIKNNLRFVTPYIYTYKLFSKKRWIGKKIADVLASEFCAYDMNYFLESIKKGYIKVNNKNVSSDYIIKNNDFIEHKLLLFEKPVLFSKIIILYEDENFICVYKSSSIPTHPVGFYQYNSLLRILQNYMCLSKNQSLSNSKNDKLDDIIKISFNFKKTNFQNSNIEFQTNNENYNIQSNHSTENLEKKEQLNLINHQKNRICEDNFYTNNLENKNNKINKNHLNEENISTELNKTSSKDLNDNNMNIDYYLNCLKYIKDKQISCISNDHASESEENNIFCNNSINKKEELNNEKGNKLGNENDNKFYNKINKKLNKKNNVKNNEEVDNKDNDNLYIYTLHRLDKLTSGIVLFGKNKKISTSFSENLSNNKIKKTYIARVDGDFRKIIKELLNGNKVLSNVSSEDINDLIEEYCNNSKNNNVLKFNDGNSFKNDIFLYENNYKKQDFQEEVNMKKLIEYIKDKKNDLKECFDISKYEKEEFFDDNFQNISNSEDDKLEIYHKYFIIDFGYMYCESKKLLKYVFTKYTNSNYKELCHYCLKPSITKFMFLSYNSQINESIVLCQPITGRTHQIRAHLNSLSFPISNDSHYNKKFEEEYIKKSNYLYLDSYIDDNKINEENKRKEQEIKKNLVVSEKYEYFPLIPFLNTSFNWLYDENIDLNNEYDEEYINKYFFKKISNVTYHSSGIFLHSFRYTWEQVIDVFTLLPKWCYLFFIPKNILIFLLYGDLS
ncbi:pseudouridylate synthase, putative [Plasmodium gallinaceum]|uniref:Pseudouridylate synthase, putative n=1 Tax=Plasmodium gallinaceum TaxID=5849 RepID=A0A1J1GVW3_PLAGA|nr:pseudouridylate synthase, putative [Plasmodium gallinaceum]CRG96688.1 pseudouridylate synthase, putative [Plasmodium gallinaceum]